jgi:hypothetical protein
MELRVGMKVKAAMGEGVVERTGVVLYDVRLDDGRRGLFFVHELTPIVEPVREKVMELGIGYIEELRSQRYICEKAGECVSHKPCVHRSRHEKNKGCGEPCMQDARCIPVKPEERDWFVMAMPKRKNGTPSGNAGWMLGTMMTKAQAEKALATWRFRDDCEYRILRWQDGKE